jgi:PDZ domain-containing protein
MRLVKVTTMDSAVKAIQAWTKDPSAKLPACGSAS